MTRSLYRRDSALMRTVSLVVAFTFVLSLAGPVVASPVQSAETSVVAETVNPETPVDDASEGEGQPGGEPEGEAPAGEEATAPEDEVMAPSEEVPPTTTEPPGEMARTMSPGNLQLMATPPDDGGVDEPYSGGGVTPPAYKVDPPQSGTFNTGFGYSITVDIYDTSWGEVFDFTSTRPISRVEVKGGPDQRTYTYDPPVTSGTALHAPFNATSGTYYDLSHMTFYPAAIGSIRVFKFEDVDGSGTQNGTEGPLGGFTFKVYNSADELVATGETDSTGYVRFDNLAVGSYTVHEEEQDAYVLKTPNDVSVTVTDGGVANATFGNQLRTVRKTFDVTVPDLSDWVKSYEVWWESSEGNGSAELEGTGGSLSAHHDFLYGAEITAWGVTAILESDEEVSLGQISGSEELEGNQTNTFEFTPASISGEKTYDGEVPDPLPTWEITLKRGDVVWATTQTDGDGEYSFDNLIPGTYTLEETMQDGFEQVSAPSEFEVTLGTAEGSISAFSVAAAGGSAGLDFENRKLRRGISVVKRANLSEEDITVEIGDEVTYDVIVTNTGLVPVTLQTVFDVPHFGSVDFGTLPPLAPSQSVTIPLGSKSFEAAGSYENTVTVTGTTIIGPVSDDDPITVTVARAIVDKKFEISVPDLSSWVSSYEVWWESSEGDDSAVLEGSGGSYSATEQFPQGTEITAWGVRAVLPDDSKVSLGQISGSEVLEDSLTTNTFTFTPAQIQGLKAYDGEQGTDRAWTITLRRGDAVYATTNSAVPSGAFSFSNLIPGSYSLSENSDPAFAQLSAPAPFDVTLGTPSGSIGAFSVAAVGPTESLNFLNDPLSASINVIKTASASLVKVGTPVSYTATIYNTGEVPVTITSVIDPVFGTIAFTATTIPVGDTPIVVPLGVRTFTVPGTYPNTVVVGGTSDAGPVGDDDSESVVAVNSALGITKLVNGQDAVDVLAGTQVTYTYTVSNLGTTDLTITSLSDDKLNLLAQATPAFTLPFTLAAGASRTFTANAVISAETLNVVTVAATDPFAAPLTASADALVRILEPSVRIVKTASPTVALVGDTITYTYVVTNTGDTVLSPVIVTDDKLGTIGTIASLDPGQSATLTATIVASADVTNVGTAVGTVPGTDTTVRDDSTATVDVIRPAIDVEKLASPTEIIAGETVTYTYTVTNIGDVDLFNVTLVDDKLGSIATIASLPVGTSQTFNKTAVINETTTNVVVATGTDARGNPATDSDSAIVDVALPFTPPDLAIEKDANKDVASPGETVRYTLTYENVAAGTAASDFTIVDDFDERYVTVIDDGGGTVSGGKIRWEFDGPLEPEDGPQTISYTVRIDPDLPESVSIVRNTVVISSDDDDNPDNDRDDWDVEIDEFLPYTEEDEWIDEDEDFLPYTGGQLTLILLAAGMVAAFGLLLRRLGKGAS